MKTGIIFMACLMLYSFPVFSQINEEAFFIGKTFTFQPEILEDEREIQVFLPDGYEEVTESYPTLYVLDGQRYFLHAVSLQQSFLNFRQTSPFIIVGIKNKRSDRNRLYTQNAEKYLSFIEKEVIRFVDDRFRTSEDRMIFGWAHAGGFVVQALIDKPELFKSYIAASPFPIQNKLDDLDRLISNNSFTDKHLFFSAETKPGLVQEETKALHILLKEKAPEQFNWTFKELPGEEHRSTAFSSLYHGIQQFYQCFPELQFDDLTAFKEAGGLPYVYSYYTKRAQAFGFKPEVADWTMFSLCRNAIREKDFDQFTRFMEEFGASNFMSKIRISRAVSIADFYSENAKHQEAINILKGLNEVHPESSTVLNRLGDNYNAINDNRTANEYYERAKKINQR